MQSKKSEAKPLTGICEDKEQWQELCARERVGSTIGEFLRPLGKLFRRGDASEETSVWQPKIVVPHDAALKPIVHAVPGTDERAAAEIMGRNFFGIEAAIERLKLTPTARELESYPGISWTTEELCAVKDTHILVAGFPLTIYEMRAKTMGAFCYDDSWYRESDFAHKEFVASRWYLIRKSVVPGSLKVPYTKHRTLLTLSEAVPKVCDLAYAMFLYYRVTGEWLFRGSYAMCCDKIAAHVYGPGVYRTFVGTGYGRDGYIIIDAQLQDSDSRNDVGLASELVPRALPR